MTGGFVLGSRLVERTKMLSESVPQPFPCLFNVNHGTSAALNKVRFVVAGTGISRMDGNAFAGSVSPQLEHLNGVVAFVVNSHEIWAF